MKIRPLTVLIVAMASLAIWVAFRPGGGEPVVHQAQPAEPTAGVNPSQTSSKLPQSARPSDKGLGQPAREASVEQDPEIPDEVPLIAEEIEASEEAVLIVIAQDRATGDRLPNVRVVLSADPPDRDISHIDGHAGSLSQAPVTDNTGRAEFRLPVGTASKLEARGEDDHVGVTGNILIPPLESGERRETIIELQVGYDLRLFGRVVEAEGGAPVSSARVRFQSHSWTVTAGALVDVSETHIEVITDSEGLFDVLLPSWAGLVGRVDHPGFGPALFRCDAGHEQSNSTLEVELEQGALLFGELLVTSQTQLGQFSVHVKVSGQALLSNPNPGSMWPLGDFSWTARVRADGTWEIEELPVGVGLEVELRGPGNKLRRHQKAIVLAPGEERGLDWQLGSGATLRGRAIVADSGAPHGGQRMWLFSDDGYSRRGLFESDWEPMAKTRTDQKGNFVFEDVPPGRWLVGPAPRHTYNDQSVVPLAQTVEILAGAESVDVLVEVYRGLHIRGTVTDPVGGPAKESWIFCNHLYTSVNAECDDDGSFSLGPLPPGEYALRASGTGYAASDIVMANAGAEGVALRLNLGGGLSGVVIDTQSDARQAAEVFVFPEENMEPMFWSGSNNEGQFDFDELPPGMYRITACTEHLFGLVRNVHVSAGSKVEDVVVPMEPGSRVHIRYDGTSEMVRFQFIVDGDIIAWRSLGPGDSGLVVLPAGEATVRISGSREGRMVTLGERTVTLIVGEEAQVVWP